ncbi:CAP domain-containing protein [Gynurincola endophyticus]|uniref:CAP domain-containing protein n=1 Tax=Gynurincola endophyticus TaxID=2479004 RepID=UPI000F8EEB9D|nr:CAP domain-containing protein [Gynurincola endophyticus]
MNIAKYWSVKGIWFVFILVLCSCQKNDDNSTPSCADGIQNQGETSIDCGGPCAPCSVDKEKVIQDYKNFYLGSAVSDPGWNGNATACIAGSVSVGTHDKVLQRINYFRRLVGLNDNTTWDVSKFAQYQQTALLMKANNALSHNPPDTWSCWTSVAHAGAASANLALGKNAADAITLFIEDPGAGNEAVGHRRWILHSPKTQFSYGSTDNTMALGVIGTAGGNTNIPPYIAYPSEGYFPQQLVFQRWSFGIPNANFTNAQVTMTGPAGINVTLNVISRTATGMGDNTIVWEPSNVVINSNSDMAYTIRISGVQNAPQSSYNYTVVIIKP